MNIYVGSLAYEVTDRDLEDAFSAFGQVASARVIIDRASNRSKGFGFVEMANDEEARAAIQGLNGTELKGRTLNVNEARARGETGRR